MITRQLAAVCLGATLYAGGTAAQSTALPPLELVEAAVAAAPGPMAADAEIARADAAADRLRAGGYELELTAGYARRNVSGGDRDFDEWNGGLRRSIRWPDKRSADVSLARVEIEIAEAGYDAAWRRSVLEWAALWTEWRASAALARVADAAAQDAETLADGEARRVAIGSGRALDRDRLLADAALARLAAEQAERRRADAEAALAIAFPTFPLPESPPPLDEATSAAVDAMSTDDALALTPAVLEARLRVEQADLQARRARLDLRPDPTVGLEAFSEFNGDETGLGVSVSIPLTGRARRGAAREAEGARSASLAALAAAEQQARQRHARAVLRAGSAARAAASASAAADAARTAVDRIERGRAINASSVTEVISVRQAARAAETAHLEALAEAAAAELELAILEGRLLAAP